MAKMQIVFSYHGYPMTRAAEVVLENITGNEDWKEYLAGVLQGHGVTAGEIAVGTPFPPDDADFVAVRVPVVVSYTGKQDAEEGRDVREYCKGKPLASRMASFCANAADFEEGFYCDSGYWEEVE